MQEQISQMLLERASAGKTVVRLQGGALASAGGEEWHACAAAGSPVTVIPGVSSAIAGPALADVPVMHRELIQGLLRSRAHAPLCDHLNPGTSRKSHAARSSQGIMAIGAVAGFAPAEFRWRIVVVRLAALLGQVELAVSHSSKEGIPLVKPEYQKWSLTIF